MSTCHARQSVITLMSCDTLASILATVNNCSFQSVIFGGDLNFDFITGEGGAVRGLLDDFMDSQSLVPTYTRLQYSCVQSYMHATL